MQTIGSGHRDRGRARIVSLGSLSRGDEGGISGRVVRGMGIVRYEQMYPEARGVV